MTLEGGPGNEQLEQKDQLKENQDLLQKEWKQIAPFVDEQEVGKTEAIKPIPIPADTPMERPNSLTTTNCGFWKSSTIICRFEYSIISRHV